jgi:hypothetical protein
MRLDSGVWGNLVVVVLASALVGGGVAHGASTTVREAAFGLPHIYADTDLELARENGKETAKDRLAQLLLLARVGRGTLYQAFSSFLPSSLNNDLEARLTGYTSSELNNMFDKLPQADRDALLEYCRGVNDTIEAIYAGSLPEPIEITVLRALGFSSDLFGNRTNISDQVDPFYKGPGGFDPQRPLAGFQFTPELAVSVGVLEVRNFGLGGFDEASRLNELQALIATQGETVGTEIWSDRNFINDPLAPVSVPDSRVPGFGGPLAAVQKDPLIRIAKRFPRFDYQASSARIRERAEKRAEVARKVGAWPKLGSYAWMMGGGKSASGFPWVGGFPQTGFQTPSIMHFVEHRSAEGADHQIEAAGMEFMGGPFILIGHTDSVAYTSTTAQLPVLDTFFEELVSEDTDTLRYDDEGSPAALSKRTETIRGGLSPDLTLTLFRSHARGGNGGTRAIADFRGDASGTVDSAGGTTLTDSGAFGAGFANGFVAIVDGKGAGQMRKIGSATANTLTLNSAWTTIPDTTSEYVAVDDASTPIIGVALDSASWLEETTAILGFSAYQRAETVLDVRAGARLIPTTHNFISADNQTFNGIGTQSGSGNIGYYSSGFARIRQGNEDLRLPMDGTGSNPLVVVAGTVSSATPTTLVGAATPFTGQDFTPPAINFRYENPDASATSFIVSIMSGAGFKQTRRIASNTADTLTLETTWGVTPQNGDTFEVYEILAIPEAVNPAEGHTGNWNNKAATGDPGNDFGRQFRSTFIVERLDPENEWDIPKQEKLNEDVAGLGGEGRLGRFLIPRLREAVTAVGNGGVPEVDTVLAALETQNAAPELGRFLVDPVLETVMAGEVEFMEDLVNQLASDIYGDEYAGAISVPGGDDALNIVQHAIDSAEGDVTGAYTQAYSGDYFNGVAWEEVVRDSLATLAPGGIPADSPRGDTTYVHPMDALFPGTLTFPPTPLGNRGVWEQIVEAGTTVRGEFMFPLGQSGLIEGTFAGGPTSIDPHFTSLHTIWRDWRFVPMLRVAPDLAGGGNGDGDSDGVLDGYERWYFGDTSQDATDDGDKDGATLLDEYLAGSDPTSPDTDGDQALDGADSAPQDRLVGGITTADQLVEGKKIVVRDKDGDATKRRLVVISKDPTISTPAKGATGDPTLKGALLRIKNPSTSEQDYFVLDADLWEPLGQNPVGKNGYKYLDRNRERGPCKIVLVKPTRLVRAVCFDDRMSFTLNEAQQTVIQASLTLGTSDSSPRYCMEFGGVIKKDSQAADGKVGLFRSIDSTAPSACPTP